MFHVERTYNKTLQKKCDVDNSSSFTTITFIMHAPPYNAK